MLIELSIKNLIIFDDVTIHFNNNMTAITGDTGAGKSVILCALNLLSGTKADTKLIKNENFNAEVNATFRLNSTNSLNEYLINNDLIDISSQNIEQLNNDKKYSSTCILRRVITKEGKSRNYINNTPVTLQVLKNIGNKLLYIHGQHEHLNLFKQDYQRNILDIFGQLHDILKIIKELYQNYNAQKLKIVELKDKYQFFLDSVDFYEYQLNELLSFDIKENEYNEIHSQYKELLELKDNQNLITNICEEALPDITENLEKVLNSLSNFKTPSSEINSAETLLKDALIAISESQNDLNKLNFDSNNLTQLEELDQRLTTFHDLARKHKVQSKDLYQKQLEIEQKVSDFKDSEQLISKAEKQLQLILTQYNDKALEISRFRENVAKLIIAELKQIMPKLGIPDFELDIKISKLEMPTSHGLDNIEFLVRTNKDTKKDILSKVLSGGELSRLALAIQIICSKIENTPSLIFDEVDVGISGATAEIVGKLLKSMGANTQIICITHLPQVAAQADTHLLVTKENQDNKTISKVISLEPNARINELARILGGIKITKQTLEHAKELFLSAQGE